MRRTIRITAAMAGIGAAVAGMLFLLSINCGAWAPLGCRGVDAELTRLAR